MCFSFSYKTKYAIVKCFVLVNCFKPSEISKEEKLGKLKKTWGCLGKKGREGFGIVKDDGLWSSIV